jgi:hypothetical protein
MRVVMARRCLRWSVAGLALAYGFGIGVQVPGGAAEPSPPGPEKPPDRWTLPVTLHAQETELWCWAATGQMTMEFLGKPISQAEQVNFVSGRHDCGEEPHPRPCVRGGSVVLSPFGFSFDASSGPLSEAELVRQIYTHRKPIPFAWQFPGGGGHASLVVGYARQKDGTLLVECLDPWPPPGKDRRAWSGGQRVFMPYARWARDYDHVFGGAMYNVTRNP